MGDVTQHKGLISQSKPVTHPAEEGRPKYVYAVSGAEVFYWTGINWVKLDARCIESERGILWTW
jgi:hypothetical protein